MITETIDEKHKGRLKWASHVERMAMIRCPLSVGKRRRGRPRMGWEDSIKRDLGRVGGEWRTTAEDRSSWRLLIENVVREK